MVGKGCGVGWRSAFCPLVNIGPSFTKQALRTELASTKDMLAEMESSLESTVRGHEVRPRQRRALLSVRLWLASRNALLLLSALVSGGA